jgi:hypothetical protein
LLAALAVWLVLPGSDEPASRGTTASRPAAERHPLESAGGDASRAATPAAATALLQPDRALPGDRPDRAPEGDVSRRADPSQSAAGGEPRGRPAVPEADRVSGDAYEPTNDFAVERTESASYRREPHIARIRRQDLSAPDSVMVEQLVEREVPEGSVPPEHLEEARADARARIVEEQLILDQLARQSAGEGASELELRNRRDLGKTLLSAEDPETRERILQRAADQIDAQP